MGDHGYWALEFGCTRVAHTKEKLGPVIEHVLQGSGPWQLEGIPEVEIYHVPGHTSGHIAMFHKPTKALFTGEWGGREGKAVHLGRGGRGGARVPQSSVASRQYTSPFPRLRSHAMAMTYTMGVWPGPISNLRAIRPMLLVAGRSCKVFRIWTATYPRGCMLWPQ